MRIPRDAVVATPTLILCAALAYGWLRWNHHREYARVRTLSLPAAVAGGPLTEWFHAAGIMNAGSAYTRGIAAVVSVWACLAHPLGGRAPE
jgi:hypothetical protein